MKLSKAQALAEQAIYDYTSSTKWQQVKYMTWTTAEMQDVIAKALVKNIEVIQCCTQLKDGKAFTFEDWLYKNQIKKIDRLYFAKDGTEQDFNALHRRYVQALQNL